MDIEIAEPGRMSQTGHSLLKLIQDNTSPILDLFVRESIQNSLDAGLDTAKFVSVKYVTGTFSPAELNRELNEVSSKLDERYPAKKADFIAVIDSNTCGLTGPLHFEDVQDGNYGNLLKLVYEISKEQSKSGSGGSWGLGKTIYYRIGIGLVLYYSRIKDASGQYVSRLAACMVEDENSPEAIIPKPYSTNRGIAWWGAKRNDKHNSTVPETDENEIQRILSIFNLRAYSEEETGTTVIIPYVNKEFLLKNNKEFFELESDESNNYPIESEPYWYRNIEDYLSIAVQRWYSPRLDNPYFHDQYLKVSINDEELLVKNMQPAFQAIQALYNRAQCDPDYKIDSLVDIFTREKVSPVEVIDINTTRNLHNKLVGKFCYTVLSDKDLGMLPPRNKKPPEQFYGISLLREGDRNQPIIAFTRKPGMIISYENSGKWVHGIPATDDKQYFVGIFVLNWKNHFKKYPELTLNEYMRQSEEANHRGWSDHSIGDDNPRILSNLQTLLRKKVIEKIQKNDTPVDPGQLLTSLGKTLAKVLLPESGFGKNPEKKGKSGGGSGGNSGRWSDFRFTLGESPENIMYSEEGVTLKGDLVVKGTYTETGFSLEIAGQSEKIDYRKWIKDTGLNYPFSIQKIRFTILKINEKDVNRTFDLNPYDNQISYKGLNCEMKNISCKETKYGYGFIVRTKNKDKFAIRFDEVFIEIYETFSRFSIRTEKHE